MPEARETLQEGALASERDEAKFFAQRRHEAHFPAEVLAANYERNVIHSSGFSKRETIERRREGYAPSRE